MQFLWDGILHRVITAVQMLLEGSAGPCGSVCVCVCVCFWFYCLALPVHLYSRSPATVSPHSRKKKTVLRKSFQLTSDSLAAWNVFFSTLHYVLVQGQIPALEDFLTFLLSLIWIKIYCVHVRVSYVNASHLTVHVSLPSSLCAAEMLVY